MDPPTRGIDPLQDRAFAEFAFTDAVTAVSAELAVAGDSPEELAIVWGRVGESTVRRLVRRVPSIDLIVVAQGRAPGSLDSTRACLRWAGTAAQTRAGWIDSTLVVVPPARGNSFAVLHLGLSSENRITQCRVDTRSTGRTVERDAVVIAAVDSFYADVDSRYGSLLGLAGRPAGGRAPPSPGYPGYAGADKCAPCHRRQHDVWLQSAHARALLVLEQCGLQYRRDCRACHATQPAAPGWNSPLSARHLSGVQCEACHGAGAAHVDDPGKTGPVWRPTQAICTACHPGSSVSAVWSAWRTLMRDEPRQ
ncbi:MAG: cytochrome c family protein [Candidatus Latescibacterota bacterium]